MKKIIKTHYQCDKCKEVYSDKKDALKCEKQPITMGKSYKIGDKITITKGQSKGKKARITRKFVYDMQWGHYAAERYWHTVGLIAETSDGWSRQLTFDDYI